MIDASPNGTQARGVVLVVDDHKAFGTLAAEVLQRDGYHVASAGSSSEARSFLEAVHVSAVITATT